MAPIRPPDKTLHRSVSPRTSVASMLLVAAAALLLPACTTTPVSTPEASRQGPETTTPAPTVRRGGGYYKDDGPDALPPHNLEAVPDAEPRLEPLHRFANRPYNVFGQDYVPVTRLAPHRERGLASWYGRRFHGNPTSSGERYDMYAMTAAHPTLPIPSYARVTHIASGRTVVVRINDRGPFHKGRVIDLSYTAAYRLGYINAGSAEVEVEQILPDELPMATVANSIPPIRGRTLPPLAVEPAVAVAPSPTGEVPALTSAGPGIFLQLGAFGSIDNAEGFRATVTQQIAAFAERLEVFADGSRFRLHAGPYASELEARLAAEQIAAVLKTKPFVVVR